MPSMTATTANGVDVDTLFATLDLVKGMPAAAQFQFRATNEWVRGTHSRTTVKGFFGAGEEREHNVAHTFDTDHPEVLVGTDAGPTPVEYLLVGLAGCITAGIGNIASARGVVLESVSSRIEGDIDLNGILGFGGARNGYQQLRLVVSIAGDADEATLRDLVEQSRARSAVYDVLTNGVPVAIDVEVG